MDQEQKALKKLVNPNGLKFFSISLYNYGKRTIFIVALLILASCATKRPYGGSYRKAYVDRECNHSHICCQMDCPCCTKMPIKKAERKKREQ